MTKIRRTYRGRSLCSQLSYTLLLSCFVFVYSSDWIYEWIKCILLIYFGLAQRNRKKKKKRKKIENHSLLLSSSSFQTSYPHQGMSYVSDSVSVTKHSCWISSCCCHWFSSGGQGQEDTQDHGPCGWYLTTHTKSAPLAGHCTSHPHSITSLQRVYQLGSCRVNLCTLQ